jgi:hypothetical protein
MNTLDSQVQAASKTQVGELEAGILRTLLYFDLFHHPMSAEEIRRYMGAGAAGTGTLSSALEALVEQGLVFAMSDFYALRKIDLLTGRRIHGERRALSALHTAKKYTRIISAFPFVRMVSISGSLSKGYMDQDADIDYFVVTEPGRLWLCRTLLVAFRWVFLLNSRKYFCINYFLSSDNLSIPDRNIYTAIETVSLIPTYNYPLYLELLQQNAWVREWLPYAATNGDEWCVRARRQPVRRMTEWLFSGWLGRWMEARCYRLTLYYRKKKFSHFDEPTFQHRMRARKDASKHHPSGFQERILKSYDRNVRDFEARHAIRIA